MEDAPHAIRLVRVEAPSLANQPREVRFPLEGGAPHTLGRAPESDVVLQSRDPRISAGLSRCHARIFVTDGVPCVVDVASKNGVFVNNVRVSPSVPIQLKIDDEVRLGSGIETREGREFTFVVRPPASDGERDTPKAEENVEHNNRVEGDERAMMKGAGGSREQYTKNESTRLMTTSSPTLTTSKSHVVYVNDDDDDDAGKEEEKGNLHVNYGIVMDGGETDTNPAEFASEGVERLRELLAKERSAKTELEKQLRREIHAITERCRAAEVEVRAKTEACAGIERVSKVHALRYSALRRELEEIFSCPICMELRANMGVLPCGHLVCKSCWHGWRANKAECATCRAPMAASARFVEPPPLQEAIELILRDSEAAHAKRVEAAMKSSSSSSSTTAAAHSAVTSPKRIKLVTGMKSPEVTFAGIVSANRWSVNTGDTHSNSLIDLT